MTSWKEIEIHKISAVQVTYYVGYFVALLERMLYSCYQSEMNQSSVVIWMGISKLNNSCIELLTVDQALIYLNEIFTGNSLEYPKIYNSKFFYASFSFKNLNPLSDNFTKWSNTLKQLPTNCWRIVWVCLPISVLVIFHCVA